MVGIAEASRRNVIANTEDVEKLFAATELIGGSAESLSNSFLDVGVGIGQIGPQLEDSINYIQSIGGNTKTCINGMEKLIIRLIKKVLLGYKMKYFWLAIRISSPNKNFDIPRWHKDGTFFTGDNDIGCFKFITTLKGPGTLLIKSTKKINKIYEKTLEEKFTEMRKYKTIQEKIKIDDNFRPIFAKKFVKEKYIQAKNNDGILFYTGFPHDNAALHSEPKMDTSRIFISILPSSYENIKDLQKSNKNQ